MIKKLVLTLLVAIVFLSGCSIKKVDDLSQFEKFAKEYSVSKDNPFKYVGIDEILEIFESGTGVVFFGNSDDEFSRETVRLFTEAIEDSEVKNIDVYYYDPVVIRDNKDYKYNELLALLEGYLNKNNDEDYLYLPDIYFVKEGKIIGHDNESAFVATSNEEYSIDEIKNKLFNKYVKLLNDYNREDTDE